MTLKIIELDFCLERYFRPKEIKFRPKNIKFRPKNIKFRAKNIKFRLNNVEVAPKIIKFRRYLWFRFM